MRVADEKLRDVLDVTRNCTLTITDVLDVTRNCTLTITHGRGHTIGWKAKPMTDVATQ